MDAITNSMVSVCMITYNHEKYISQAIEGVLIQKADFQIELVIGEDYSTDSTREICKKYASMYPNIIRLLPSHKNLGIMPNFIRTLQACTGKYIALCEGDDYWTDPYKLQKQVDFLEENPEYGLVHTKFSIVDEHCNPISVEYLREMRENITDGKVFYKLLAGPNFIATLTVMLRREILSDILKKTKPKVLSSIQDYWLWLRISDVSQIKYLDFDSANYRVTSTGVSRSKSNSYFAPRYLVFMFDAIEQAIRGDTSFPETKKQKVCIARKIIAFMRNKDISLFQKLYIVKLIYRCPYVLTIVGGFLFDRFIHGEKRYC